MSRATHDWERPHAGPARRALTGFVALAGAAVLAVAAAFLLSGRDGGQLVIRPPQPVETGDPPSPDPGPAGPEEAWDRRRPAPLIPRSGHSVTWADGEAIVWGGRSRIRHLTDGAAYDPATDLWRRIAEPPLAGRTDHVAVWTGQELVVWGGRRTDDFGPLALSDGAAYDPARDRWRPLPEAPIDGRWASTAHWTGDELLIWGGRSQRLRTVHLGDGATYEPERDEWRPLPPPPRRTTWSPAAAWTGQDLLVWGAVSESRTTASGAVYNKAAGNWRHLGTAPLPVAPPAVATWVGGVALVATPGEVLAYHPAQDRWEHSAGQVTVRPATRVVRADAAMVLLDAQTGLTTLVEADGAQQTLTEPAAPPRPATAGQGFAGAWTGHTLIVAGGSDSDGRLGLRIWTPPQ